MVVELDEDLDCNGDECSVDTLSLIEMESSPPLYYEFMPFPCIELAFSTDAKKVVDQHNRAMCADPLVNNVVLESCCPADLQGRASSYCEYSGEKMSFEGSKSRCEAAAGSMCDWNVLRASHISPSCGLSHRRYENSFRWTSESCSTQVLGKC